MSWFLWFCIAKFSGFGGLSTAVILVLIPGAIGGYIVWHVLKVLFTIPVN